MLKDNIKQDIDILCTMEDFWKVYTEYFKPKIEQAKDITLDFVIPEELKNITPEQLYVSRKFLALSLRDIFLPFERKIKDANISKKEVRYN